MAGFYMMPRELFSPEFADLSNNSKLIYMLFLDRSKVSKKNNRIDDEGKPFIIFSRGEISNLLNISKRCVSYCLRQLEEYGLIRMEPGRSMPLIFVNHLQNLQKGVAKIAKEDPKNCKEDLQNMQGGLQNLQGGLQNLQGGLQNLQPSYTNRVITKSKTEEIKRKCYSLRENPVSGNGKEKERSTKRKTLSQYLAEQPNAYELALAKIKCVQEDRIFTDSRGREKKLTWNDITDRDFTYYYLKKHEEILGRTLPDGIRNGQGVTAFKNGIRLYFNIPKEMLCRYIDEMLLIYKDHPKNTGILSWGMITGYPKLIDYLYEKAKANIETEEEDKKMYENDDAEDFWWLNED